MKKLPASIQIMGRTWKIKLLDQVCDGEAWGAADHTTRTIEIKKGMTSEKNVEILIHELIHAIFFEIGMYSAGMPREIEELICHNLGRELSKHFSIQLKTRRNK